MKKFGNMLWGIVLIAAGLIVGGNALGITHINIFFDGWWTVFIIVPCFIGLFKNREKTGSIIGLLIGIALLLGCQNILNFDLMRKLIFPAILVIIGLSIVFKDVLGGKVSREMKKLNEKRSKDASYCATFSQQNVNFDGEVFAGCELNAVFGEVKCDLRNAKIEEDAVINASGIFGAVTVYVPSNVKVIIKPMAIFGGVDDKANTNPDEKSHTIYVNATALFGGVDIK